MRTKKGKTKKRIILDIKESKIRYATKKKYRVLLPRSIDAVNDALELIARCRTPEEAQDLLTALEADGSELETLEDVEFLVLDFVDAFWQAPIQKRERKYPVGRVRGF